MSIISLLFIVFFLFTLISGGYYFFVERPKMVNKINPNLIQLQTDGFDFILYKGKIKELVSDYRRYLADMDIVIYSNSLFVGFLDPKYAYVKLPAKAIQSIKYEPNKLTLHCFQEIAGASRIVIKGNSTKQLFYIAKKLDFIIKRSKKVKVI